MELGKFENSRTFHSPKGNTKYVRDVVVTQVTEVTPEEPKIEEIKVEKPKVIKPTKTKRTRSKKNKNEKS